MTIPTSTDRVTSRIVERKIGDNLRIDDAVQRALKTKRVTDLVEKFNPAALGVLTTSYRNEDDIIILDGQHRWRAAQQAKYTGVIQTMEYHGLNPEEEAALFRMLNDAEKVQRVDAFRVACVEKDPAALHLSQIMAANGWSISSYSGEARLTAIASLERVYALSPEAAASTLAVLTAAFGHRPSAVNGSLIDGLGRIYARDIKTGVRKINSTDMVQRIADFPGGPDGLVGHARGQRAAGSGNLATHVAKVIVARYNERKRVNKLAPWE